MEPRLALIPDGEDPERGVVTPVTIKSGEAILVGLSVGYWTKSTPDGNIHIILNDSIDTIIHEVVTRKAINAEIRATDRALNGVVIKPTIILDPKTKRFKEVYPNRKTQ